MGEYDRSDIILPALVWFGVSGLGLLHAPDHAGVSVVGGSNVKFGVSGLRLGFLDPTHPKQNDTWKKKTPHQKHRGFACSYAVNQD